LATKKKPHSQNPRRQGPFFFHSLKFRVVTESRNQPDLIFDIEKSVGNETTCVTLGMKFGQK